MQAARGASLTSDAAPHQGRSKAVLVLGIALVAWLVDTGTKIYAERELAGRDPVELLGPLLRLNLTRNPGAAFSTGSSVTPLISVFAAVAFVVALWFAFRVRDRIWAWAFGLLVAGIAGNLTDRLFREPGPLRGHVVDFLELPHWPVFNIADVCINVAAGLIVLQSLRGIGISGRRHDGAEHAQEPAR
ncbi:MAG: signal peptidase II [Nocardioidaceae bacterium]|nr:signal peptidase II [Nocardioidaceae bacterium]